MNSEEERVAKVGVFSIGLEAYWAQFPNLKDRLEGVPPTRGRAD